jgi:hypothetical protein
MAFTRLATPAKAQANSGAVFEVGFIGWKNSSRYKEVRLFRRKAP